MLRLSTRWDPRPRGKCICVCPICVLSQAGQAFGECELNDWIGGDCIFLLRLGTQNMLCAPILGLTELSCIPQLQSIEGVTG